MLICNFNIVYVPGLALSVDFLDCSLRETFSLASNQITFFLSLVGQLVRLEQLSVSGNLLTCLPETIGSLRNVSNFTQ
jgi:Leucine-rich repeat (LRR) protein